MADLEKRPLESVVEMAASEADGEKVTVAELLEIFEDRGFGPILIALGLLAASPVEDIQKRLIFEKHDSATGHAPLAGTPTQVTPNFNK